VNSKIYVAEFVRAMTDPAMPRPRGRDVHMEVSFHYSEKTKATMVTWTCAVCNYRNVQRWYGRDFHICLKCEQPTDVK